MVVATIAYFSAPRWTGLYKMMPSPVNITTCAALNMQWISSCNKSAGWVAMHAKLSPLTPLDSGQSSLRRLANHLSNGLYRDGEVLYIDIR